MNDVYIIGSGMIRFGKYPDATVKSMAEEAIGLALEDASLEKKDLQDRAVVCCSDRCSRRKPLQRARMPAVRCPGKAYRRMWS